MAKYADLPIQVDGKLTENIIYFARALRKAGIRVGTSRVVDAIEAVRHAGFSTKYDFYLTLRAIFIARREDFELYGQVFRLFWRDPQYLEHMMAMLRPMVRGVNDAPQKQSGETRAADALLDGMDIPREAPEDKTEKGEEIEFDATLTFSQTEKLKSADFDQMTNEEMRKAERFIREMEIAYPKLPSRRLVSSHRGTAIDRRKTLRQAVSKGGEVLTINKKTQDERKLSLVVLLDISGSMSNYSRMFLHFMHAMANQEQSKWRSIHGFTLGTRLTNISRQLKHKDVDETLKQVAHQAKDWEGGTRLGATLEDFNVNWSRRVLGQGAVVILVSDGLDYDDPDALAKQAEKIKLSSKRFIWVNPLLRWDEFEPKARGVRALLPHVDNFVAGHNINSLEALATALKELNNWGEKDRMMRML